MNLSETLAQSVVLVVALLFLAAGRPHAGETAKNPKADRIVRPTRIKPLDINSASADELKRLPGIDDVHAEKIMVNRPYQKKDELISRQIVPETTFKKIKDRIIAVQGSER
jgi:competence protein ComEA